MSRTPFALALLALACVACDGDKDSADSADEACGVSVTTFPLQGAVNAYYRSDVEFKLTKPDATAQISTDIPGSQEVSADGLTVYWRLSAPLAPTTTYTASLTYCTGTVELGFTTSALGTAIPDTGTLQGRTYLLNLADARITEPPGIGALLSSELDGVSIYTGIIDVTDTEITVIGGLGREGAPTPTQEYCDPTIDFPTADFTGSPHFEISGEGATPITVAGTTVYIEDLRIAGDFASDLSYFGGGVLEGTIDTRPLDVEFGDGEEGFICKTASALGVVCDPCSDGLAFCLSLVADSIDAQVVDGLELVAIDGNNCMGCVEGPPPDVSDVCEQDPAAP